MGFLKQIELKISFRPKNYIIGDYYHSQLIVELLSFQRKIVTQEPL